MPFGLKMSQDVFQAKIDQTFEGVIGIADDIVVCGTTEKEHDQHLHDMMARCKSTGLKPFNPDNCKIKQRTMKFYGIICGEGVQPDPDKVSALHNMAPPSTTQELQTFLELPTWVHSFPASVR